jgi:hypothetical protein
MNCPTCKAQGAYQGFNTKVECISSTCTNYSQKQHTEWIEANANRGPDGKLKFRAESETVRWTRHHSTKAKHNISEDMMLTIATSTRQIPDIDFDEPKSKPYIGHPIEDREYALEAAPKKTQMDYRREAIDLLASGHMKHVQEYLRGRYVSTDELIGGGPDVVIRIMIPQTFLGVDITDQNEVCALPSINVICRATRSWLSHNLVGYRVENTSIPNWDQIQELLKG